MFPFLWAVSRVSTLSSALQILIFLPLTLATLSTSAFLLLSFLLSIHAFIHGTLVLLFRRSELFAVLQVPMHPFLLLVVFNAFSTSSFNIPWLVTAAKWWGELLKWSGPLFIGLEGLSSLLVSQKLGQEGKKLVEKGEGWQFGLLIATAAGYVISAWWIISSYGTAASSPLSSTFLGVALTAFVFLSFIGFVLRRTNIIESSALSLFIAYNIWLCGFHDRSFSEPNLEYVSPLTHFLPLLETLINFVTNTLPKPVLIALLYRLTVLHLASRILPTIGADVWDDEVGVDGDWNERPTSNLTRILLTYRQFIFVSVYSHLLLLDHSSSVWWRWMNIFSTLALWSVELLVSPEDDAIGGKEWKID